MPLTKISAPKHLPFEKVKALADAVHEGLVQTCYVPRDDLFQLISRFDADQMILDAHFGGVNRTKDACIVEILFLTGRSDDHKRALYKLVSKLAVVAGFHADDIMIALTENSFMDWSIGHGMAYADRLAKA